MLSMCFGLFDMKKVPRTIAVASSVELISLVSLYLGPGKQS